MKKILILYLLIIISCNKQEKIDNDLDKSKDFKLIEISKNDKNSLKIRISSNTSALNILKKKKNDSLNRSKLYQITELFKTLQDREKFIYSSDVLIAKCIQSKDTLQLSNTFELISDFYSDENIIDSSFFYILKSEKLLKKINLENKLNKIYLKKATIQFYSDDYTGVDLSATKSLKYSSKINDYKSYYDALNILGVSAFELGNYNKALEYHNKAILFLKNNPIEKKDLFKALSLNNIGYTYQNMDNHLKAIETFKIALKNKSLKSKLPSLYATLIDNLAYSYFVNENFDYLPNMFFEALKIRDSLGLTSKVIYSEIHLSEYYQKTKNKNLALIYGNRALNNARLINNSGDILFSLKNLTSIDSINNIKLSNEYIRISDSLKNIERISKDKFARVAFETDEIIQEKDNLEDKNRNLLYIFFGTGGLFLFLYYLRSQRAKNRELIYKQAQQKANEDIFNLMMSQQAVIDDSRTKEKQKLARELHDGVLGRMFGLRLSLDSVNRKNDEDSLMKRLQIVDELKTIEQDIREISHDLNREKQVLINNFVSIVSNLIEEQREKYESKLDFFLDTSIQWDKIASAVKINLYRILQESLQNINKYAKAKNINIGFVKNEDTIIFKISDNGMGFDVNKKSKGIGTQNMIARTNECHGEFSILSEIGEGTTITITIPLAPENKPLNN